MPGSAYAHPLEILIMVLQGIVVLVLGLGPEAGATAGYATAVGPMFQHWIIHAARWLGCFV